MRVIFAGTSEFALPALEQVSARHEVVRVLTQPDRPTGRGRRAKPTPVRELAETLGLDVAMPERLDVGVVAELAAMESDVLVVVAYGLMIPEGLLDAPRYGALNVHPSLLPRWRGAAPVERAMEAGDRETGVAIMRMDAGLDTGPVYRMETAPIRAEETSGELSDRLARRGAVLLLDVLEEVGSGNARAVPQSGEPTYAAKLSPAAAELDFRHPASELARRVMAFNPRPGAWAYCGGERMRILRARALAGTSSLPPGRVIAAGEEGIDIVCGEGFLRVLEMQRPGRRAMAAAEQARGRDWIGACFG